MHRRDDRPEHHPTARAHARAVLSELRRRDVVIAAVAAAVGIGVQHGVSEHRAGGCAHGACAHFAPSAGQAILVGVGAVVLLALRRRAPRAALVLIASLATGDAIAGHLGAALLPALALAWVVAVRRCDRIATWATIVWAALVWTPLSVGSLGFAHLAGAIVWLIAIGLGAEVFRTRRGRMAAQRRSREESALRRAEEERLRIARELHDVLAHNISLINVQSGVALHLLDERPEQARSALTIINDASGEALRELRSVLGVLRRVDEQAPRRPTAGLDRLPELVAHAAAAGVDVSTHAGGAARPLSTAVDLAAYRIVQESLTNVARHAGGHHATVSLDYGADALRIEIADDGVAAGVVAPPPSADGSGNGILGMRERAAALGGELQAGPRPDAPGFRVRARLPYGSGSAA